MTQKPSLFPTAVNIQNPFTIIGQHISLSLFNGKLHQHQFTATDFYLFIFFPKTGKTEMGPLKCDLKRIFGYIDTTTMAYDNHMREEVFFIVNVIVVKQLILQQKVLIKKLKPTLFHRFFIGNCRIPRFQPMAFEQQYHPPPPLQPPPAQCPGKATSFFFFFCQPKYLIISGVEQDSIRSHEKEERLYTFGP